MKKSCDSCSSCTKFPLWVILPFVTILTILFVGTSLNAFGEQVITISTDASDPSCADSGSCYSPSEVTTSLGSTITWSNDGGVIHTVTSGTPEDGPDQVFDSSIILSGDSFSHTFNETGEYVYFCTIHPWMTGTVLVG